MGQTITRTSTPPSTVLHSSSIASVSLIDRSTPQLWPTLQLPSEPASSSPTDFSRASRWSLTSCARSSPKFTNPTKTRSTSSACGRSTVAANPRVSPDLRQRRGHEEIRAPLPTCPGATPPRSRRPADNSGNSARTGPRSSEAQLRPRVPRRRTRNKREAAEVMVVLLAPAQRDEARREWSMLQGTRLLLLCSEKAEVIDEIKYGRSEFEWSSRWDSAPVYRRPAIVH